MFSYIAIATNAGVYTFRTDRVDYLLGEKNAEGEYEVESMGVKWMFFNIVVGGMILLTLLMKWLVPNVPDAIIRHRKRQAEIEDVLVKGQIVDDDEFSVDAINVYSKPSDFLRVKESDPKIDVAALKKFQGWFKRDSMLTIEDGLDTKEY